MTQMTQRDRASQGAGQGAYLGASGSLDDAPHRPQLPSCPPHGPPRGPTDRPSDLYGSVLRIIGISPR